MKHTQRTPLTLSAFLNECANTTIIDLYYVTPDGRIYMPDQYRHRPTAEELRTDPTITDTPIAHKHRFRDVLLKSNGWAVYINEQAA